MLVPREVDEPKEARDNEVGTALTCGPAKLSIAMISFFCVFCLCCFCFDSGLSASIFDFWIYMNLNHESYQECNIGTAHSAVISFSPHIANNYCRQFPANKAQQYARRSSRSPRRTRRSSGWKGIALGALPTTEQCYERVPTQRSSSGSSASV